MGDKGFKHRSLFDFFVARVQRYLHVALCMDPANEGFLLRCESNPALYMRCSMLWMGSWDVASMERLPLQVFAGVPEEHLPYISRISPPHLPHISPTSPPYLPQVFAGVPEEHLAAAQRPAIIKQMVKLHEPNPKP